MPTKNHLESSSDSIDLTDYTDPHAWISSGLYFVVPEDRPHEGQFLGVLGYDNESDRFGVQTEVPGEQGEIREEIMSDGILSGAFVPVERPSDLGAFLAAGRGGRVIPVAFDEGGEQE